jgi:hypothetical protein
MATSATCGRTAPSVARYRARQPVHPEAPIRRRSPWFPISSRPTLPSGTVSVATMCLGQSWRLPDRRAVAAADEAHERGRRPGLGSQRSAPIGSDVPGAASVASGSSSHAWISRTGPDGRGSGLAVGSGDGLAAIAGAATQESASIEAAMADIALGMRVERVVVGRMTLPDRELRGSPRWSHGSRHRDGWPCPPGPRRAMLSQDTASSKRPPGCQSADGGGA